MKRESGWIVGVALVALLGGCTGCDEGPPPGPGNTVGLNPACDVSLPVTGFHVAVDGTPDGDGSAGQPWDLATALDSPPTVEPGDTIWMHGGTYRGSFVGKLDGEPGMPVTIRSHPGEWARLDSRGSDEVTLQLYREWAVYRDFEVTNSGGRPHGEQRPSGIYVEAVHVRLVNLIVHDVGTGIIGSSACEDWDELARDLEVTGCLLFNNGWDADDRAHGHHLYLGNRDGTKRFVDNLVFNSFGFGFHLYTDTDRYYIEGYELVGNVWWNAGVASAGESKRYDNCLIGGRQPVRRLTLRENIGWSPGPGERNNRFGWDVPGNEDATLIDNVFVGETVFQESWDSVVLRGNWFYGDLSGEDPADHPDNTYLTSAPTDSTVIIRENPSQPGRAHIIVTNWADNAAVDVDLSGVLQAGTSFQIRNAQNYFGDPVASGVYDGSSVSLPLDSLGVAQPVGSPGAILESEQTGRAFNVFVLISQPCSR